MKRAEQETLIMDQVLLHLLSGLARRTKTPPDEKSTDGQVSA